MTIRRPFKQFRESRSLAYLLMLCLFFLSSMVVADQSTKLKNSKAFEQSKQQANQLFSKAVSSPTVPGISVAVGNQAGIIWAQGFGFSNLENNVPMTVKTKLRVGSVAKVITAAGLMRIDQKTPVDFDAPIIEFVKQWPSSHPKISLRQLTNHTSGIRHYRGEEFLSNKEYPTRVAALEIFKDDPLQFTPGSRFSYSTYAWTLVSAAMEAHDRGRNFKQIIRQEVFQPLQMNDSTFDDASPIISNRHTPYSYRDGKLINSPSVNSSYKYAGGGFLSTPSDIVKMAIAHTNTDFLPADSINQMFKPTAKENGSNFGIGWLVGWDSYLNRLNRDKTKNKKYLEMIARHENAVMHSGGSMGGVTMLILCLDHNHSAAVVKNVSGESSANVFNLALETLDLFSK